MLGFMESLSAQESTIKLTTHMKPDDRFNVSIKCDGNLKAIGAKGIETGGSPMWNGTVNYQLSVQQPEVTFTGTNITILEMGQDSIYTIDITGCPTLEDLTCPWNYLTEIDLSHSPNLKTLICYNNDLSSLDVSTCTQLEQIDCNANPISLLDLKTNTSLAFLTCGSTNIQTLDLSKCSKLEELLCPRTSVTKIDLSGLTLLTKVNCNENPQLKEINLTGTSALNMLEASSCDLEQLDISQSTALTYLILSNNHISNFSASNPQLETIDLQSNRLGTLDLSGCQRLQTITLYNNLLKGEATTAFIRSLPQKENSTWAPPRIEMIATDSPNERNICLISDVEIAKSRGWQVYGNEEATATVTPYSGSALYPVTMRVSKYGRAQLTGADDLSAVPERTELTLTVTPDENYVIDRILCNQKDIKPEEGPMTIVVRDKTLIEVSFKDPNGLPILGADPCLTIYPTPATQQIFVSGLKSNEIISLYTTTGDCLVSIQADDLGSARIDVSSYPDGNYLLGHQDGLVRVIVKH